MYSEVNQRAKALITAADPDFFSDSLIGLEKETLRIDADGKIAQSDHPSALGAALCNSQVTTDFSESLLEMVTPPCRSIDQALEHLIGIHQFILPRLENSELLWNTSMPCIIAGDDSIRIGEYGSSHNGVMKQVYRKGLALRYGRRMQAIAGIHFNYSMPANCWATWHALHKTQAGKVASEHSATALSTEGYFHMTRNLMRVGWLVPYLFGASPAICQTFLPSGQDSDLATLNEHTRYAPFGTSLRMGEIGYRYKEDAPIDLSVRHDTFENYLSDIFAHVSSVHPAYEQQGVVNEQGEYQQLTANRLQIENEYYSSVRPKQIPKKGEMPLLALKRCGIRYLELRSVDVNVFEPAGMNLEQLAMLEMLMVFSWLADSAPLHCDEMDVNKNNVKLVAHRGREPGLMLNHQGEAVSLQVWGKSILQSLEPIAQWMDSLKSSSATNNSAVNLYQNSLQQQIAKINDPSLTPSARVVDELAEHGSFFAMALSHSEAHAKNLLAQSVDENLQRSLAGKVGESIQAQRELEQNSVGSFDDFLANYYSQLNSTAAMAS